ncbi:MAG: aminoglycoside 6-adenylyltransferase [Candidatus Promineifilaceae bacterium]
MNLRHDNNIQNIVNWGKQRPSVRALLLTSTRAMPDASLDRFSDYDVILAVTSVRPFYEDRNWLEDFGRVLVVYRDPIKGQHDLERFAYITQYEDGLKIDFTLMTVGNLTRLAEESTLPDELDVGYVVLLDKDGLTSGLGPPTYRAHIPSRPAENTFLTVIEEFFHETTYVAKLLWRDELMPAKYSLDYVMKQVYLRQMLEWYLEVDNSWAIKPGALGKGMKKRLKPDIWTHLETTYVGPGLEDNWNALFKSIVLFRKVAIEVADHLAYEYPIGLEERVVTYLQGVKRLKR